MERIYWLVIVGIIGFVLLVIVGGGLLLFLGSDMDLGSAASGKTVAVIPIKGEIVLEKQDGLFESSLDSLDIVELIKEADKDPSVDAIFLDVDSLGGSVVASNQIVHALRKAEKPCYAWIGETGASAGYHIASACKMVYADADSLTASIGVIAMFPNFSGLMDDFNVGLNVIKSGELKDIGSSFRDMTDEEQALFQELVDDAFVRFKRDIRDHRGSRLSPNFDSITDGRFMSGSKAKSYGLIDEVVTRDEALELVGKELGIDTAPSQKEFGEEEVSFANLFASMGASFGQGMQKAFSFGAEANPKLK